MQMVHLNYQLMSKMRTEEDLEEAKSIDCHE